MTDKASGVDISLSSDAYRRFCVFLERSCGIVLGAGKEYLVKSRLRSLCLEIGVTNFDVIVSKLESGGDRLFREKIVDLMTTNETSWFRDSTPYNVLAKEILPYFADQGRKKIRVWSAACSSGQEPYSISMIVSEFMGANPGKLSSVEIVATDISKEMLSKARLGVYDKLSVSRGLSDERMNKFFDRQNDLWAIKKEISGRVRFTELNLMSDYTSLGKFDLIFCRNVLIYFSPELKMEILGKMTASLNRDSFVVLGSTENAVSYSKILEPSGIFSSLIYKAKK